MALLQIDMTTDSNRRHLLRCSVGLVSLPLAACAGAAGAEAWRRRPPDGPYRLQANLAYGQHPRQVLDLYLPLGPASGALLMMVHGGGWRYGDKAMGPVVQHKVERWVPQGHAFVSINYRLLPEANPWEQARDVARALAFVQAHASHWGLDLNQLVLMGHSAGAHLAALVAADQPLARDHGVRPWAGTVCLDSGALDVPALMHNQPWPLFREAFGTDPSFWQQVSPVHRLTQAPAPMMLVYAASRQRARDQNQRMARAIERVGGRAQLYAVDLSHSEINRELGLPGPYTEAVETFLASIGVRGLTSPRASGPLPRRPNDHWQSRL